MSYKESDIMHETETCFVLREKDRYTVLVNGITHATSDSSYALNSDGLSIAIARCNYLNKRKLEAKK